MHFSWIGSNLSFHCKQTIVADWFRGSLIASRKNAKSARSVAEQAVRVCFRNVFPSRTCDLSPSCVCGCLFCSIGVSHSASTPSRHLTCVGRNVMKATGRMWNFSPIVPFACLICYQLYTFFCSLFLSFSLYFFRFCSKQESAAISINLSVTRLVVWEGDVV